MELVSLFFALLSFLHLCWVNGHQKLHGDLDIPPNNPEYVAYGDYYVDLNSSVAIEHCQEADKTMDIAFVMDCTSSMNNVIAAAKSSISNLMTQLKTKMKSAIRMAIVTYTDFDVGAPGRFHILQFNPDPNAVIEHVEKFCMDPNRLGSGGQGHHPEDATGALNEANMLPWTAANRVIFHIADAPGHHTKFGNSNYPNGKPGDPQPEELLTEMNKKSIHYVLGEISPASTAQMVKFFKDYAKKLRNSEMIDKVDIRDTTKVTDAVLKKSIKLIKKNCKKKTTTTTTTAPTTAARWTVATTTTTTIASKPRDIININDVEINLSDYNGKSNDLIPY